MMANNDTICDIATYGEHTQRSFLNGKMIFRKQKPWQTSLPRSLPQPTDGDEPDARRFFAPPSSLR